LPDDFGSNQLYFIFWGTKHPLSQVYYKAFQLYKNERFFRVSSQKKESSFEVIYLKIWQGEIKSPFMQVF